MSDYFDLLEVELRAAVPRAAASGAPAGGRSPVREAQRRIRLRPGILPAALGTAATLLVVGLAIGTLGHAHKAPASAQSGARTSAAPPGTPHIAGAPPTLPELLGSFRILRRAQTAADRSWQPPASDLSGVRQSSGLSRLARTLPNGDRVFLTVEQLRTSEPDRPKGSYAIYLWVVGPDGDLTTTTLFGAGGQFTVLPLQFPAPGRPSTTPPPGGLLWTSVVPDGIGKVRWTFVCNRLARDCTGQRAIGLTVRVRNNIATGQLPGSGRCGHSPTGCVRPSKAIWYSSTTGRVVAGAGGTIAVTASQFGLKTPAPPVNGIPPRPAREMLSGGGIIGISFGELRSNTVLELNRLLGVHGGNPRPVSGDCGVDSSVTWRLGAGQAPLTMYFAKGRLVGFQYGNPATRPIPGGSDTKGPLLGTAQALTIGDTVEAARRFYRGTFKISAAQGGTWKASTGTGPIDGYLSGPPQSGTSGTLRVATIDAGTVGCPAVSP